MGKLFAMIGLPKSGKSTYSKSFLAKYTANSFSTGDLNDDWDFQIVVPRAIVRADDIRLALTGQRFNSHIEDYVHSIYYTTIKAQLLAGNDILADDTHSTWDSIRKLLSCDSKCEFWWSFPKEKIYNINKLKYYKPWAEHITICKKRAKDSGQEDLFPIIDRMAGQLERLAYEWDGRIEEEREKARNKKYNITQ